MMGDEQQPSGRACAREQQRAEERTALEVQAPLRRLGGRGQLLPPASLGETHALDGDAVSIGMPRPPATVAGGKAKRQRVVVRAQRLDRRRQRRFVEIRRRLDEERLIEVSLAA
jgi:hypothetical protein